MGRENIYEGWLIKSPPRKKFEKIWRARWRRRWFVLREGELPNQFFLEYYTDRNCRRRKGAIDLDQCEQVEAGLKLDRARQKFPFVFDIKTPHRIFYLAADTVDDMRNWVTYICQVCGLQETTRQQAPPNNVQYFNIGPDAINEAPLVPVDKLTPKSTHLLSTRMNNLALSAAYQNEEAAAAIRSTDYTNRETMVCDAPLQEPYCNFSVINRSQSMKRTTDGGLAPSHTRTQSLNDQQAFPVKKKVPAKLKLGEAAAGLFDNGAEPSPALSTCSGPYIPISECYSGSILLNNDKMSVSLGALDPRFYDTPRAHPPAPRDKSKSGHSSPTDSESVFTDDEWTHPVMPQGTLERSHRRSESSGEAEQMGWTYAQQFSRVSGSAAPPPRPPKRASGAFLEGSRDTVNSSEADSGSPVTIGPKDASSCVMEESYEIPRSHRLPYNASSSNLPHADMSPFAGDLVVSSTPNLIDGGEAGRIGSSKTLPSRAHFYTNAAPTKVEGNIFRYDFVEQGDAPIVDRKLKPKPDNKAVQSGSQTLGSHFRKPPPTINRNLKPTTPKTPSGSLRRKGGPIALTLPDENSSFDSFRDDSLILPKTPKSGEDRLQYLDLDHSNSPQKSASTHTHPSTAAIAEAHGTATKAAQPEPPNVAYTTVDFVKTEAFNRIREDSELTRAKSRLNKD